jgi:hypothetical protein
MRLAAWLTALARGTASIQAGLPSHDAILLPVQLVLDDDLTGALQSRLEDERDLRAVIQRAIRYAAEP